MSVEIYPVVHINDSAEAVRQAHLALDSGSDGIFLIDHLNKNNRTLFETYQALVQDSPDVFIGLNMLTTPVAGMALDELNMALEDGEISRLPDGLWFDDARLLPVMALEAMQRNPRLARVRLLGGAAFKYTAYYTDEPDEAARQAAFVAPLVDVVTTSGRGTGKPPSPQKIQSMKQTIGEAPLAIASGVSVDNLHEYAGAVDQLLVSTSVEVEPYSGIFEPAKLKELIEAAHQLDKPGSSKP